MRCHIGEGESVWSIARGRQTKRAQWLRLTLNRGRYPLGSHGPHQREVAQRVYRFETLDGLWLAFKRQNPAIAAKMALTVFPDKAPPTFKRQAPWYLQKGGGGSCLCGSCEGMDKLARAIELVATKLERIVEDAAVEAGKWRPPRLPPMRPMPLLSRPPETCTGGGGGGGEVGTRLLRVRCPRTSAASGG